MMKLYDYFRSTACYRVRIALHLKNLQYERINIHLINNGGEQHNVPYLEVNPQELVPSLEINGQIITQSLAIIDYLEEVFPTPSLLPQNSLDKALVKSLALIVACDMHPLNNLRVLNYLKESFQASEDKIIQWYHHWLMLGFKAFEQKLQTSKSCAGFCVGTTPTLADICLIPQVYNAQRYNFSLKNYPRIREINSHCLSLKAFQDASPKA